jgi:hypothetical protein
MAKITVDKLKQVTVASALGTDVTTTTATGQTVPVQLVEQSLVPIYRTRLRIEDLKYTFVITADGVGQKLMTFPEGGIQIHGAHFDLTLTTAIAGHMASAIVGLGTVEVTGGDADLTSTEDDIIASHQLADGTLTTATTETHSAFKTGSGVVLDGSATAKDCWLNIAGAPAAAGTVIVGGHVTVFWSHLGDD